MKGEATDQVTEDIIIAEISTTMIVASKTKEIPDTKEVATIIIGI